jgi:hypothetical protein
MNRLPLLVSVLACLLLVACSEDDPTTPDFAARLTVEVQGLPAGLPAQVVLTGPNGRAEAITATTTFDLLPPGRYTIASARASDGFGDYYPTSLDRQFDLSGGAAMTVVVAYAGLNLRGGIIALATGLPAPLIPTFAVTGPHGFQATMARGDTLTALSPGLYDLTATRWLDGAEVYAPWPATASVRVEAGVHALASLTFAPAYDVDLDLTIAQVEATQATQRPDGTVPLVAHRAAALRVHGVASTANAASAPVLVEWYRDGALVGSEVVDRTADGIPTYRQPGDLNNTWNLLLPAAAVVPGLGIRVVIDPDDQVPEAVEANNAFPDHGVAMLPVVERPTLGVRLVPVLQTANGLQGDATGENAGDFVSLLGRLMPVPEVDVDLHAVYSTSAPPLQADDANNGWGRLLAEISALRAMEDHDDRHYYGVVKCDYTSGIAGLGRLPGEVAMGWDYPGSRGRVLAHELGHNLGRAHVDCGGPAGPDPDYPYPDGSIGQWGFDLLEQAPRDPAEYVDLMSYCQPQWISDYMYEKVMAYTADVRPAAAVTNCLLVWGRRTGGQLILEPSLVVEARPSLPLASGPYRLLVRDGDGRTAVDLRFAMPEIADLPGDDSAFAWAIPLPAAKAASLASQELRGPEGRVVKVRSQHAASGRPTTTPTLSRRADLHLAWDAAAHPLLVVRRTSDGAVLGMLRDGRGVVRTEPGALDLLLGDGVTSAVMRVDGP